MKFFAVSDIHGQCDKLITSLNQAGFNRVDQEHKLIICGDMFDRGNQNLKVYHFIDELQKHDRNKVIVIKGNHELFFNKILDGTIKYESIFLNLYHNGFIKTLMEFTQFDLQSIVKNVNHLVKIIDEKHPQFLSWITGLPYYYETKNYVFTHAGIDYLAKDWHLGNWDEQVWADLGKYQHVHLKDFGFYKKLIMGHWFTSRLTHLEHDEIYYHQDQQKIFIDGGAAGPNGKINVLVAMDEEI